MDSSTSSSDRAAFARKVPKRPWGRAALAAFLVSAMALVTWEQRMRALGLHRYDLGDSKDHWAAERRKVDRGPRDQVLLIGSSRILFDTNLDVWEELTGIRPIQLALAGTPPRAFLEDIANDQHFAGLAVVEVTEFLVFNTWPGVNADALDRVRTQSPSQRAGHELYLALSKGFAFVDPNYTPLVLFERLNLPNRPGVSGPYMDVWKISESTEDRQTFLWPRLETDAALREHARAVWMYRPDPSPSATLIADVIEKTRRDVAAIRSRGGEVVFLRPPSAGPLRDLERKLLPREATWDALLRGTGAQGVHFEDYPQMQGLDLPEWSHLSRAAAATFTRAYVDVLAKDVAWLTPRVRKGSLGGTSD
jgi:hypothetical protein